jgi:hypothetical protein
VGLFACATGTTTLHGTGCSQLATGVVSGSAHVVVLVAAIPAFCATDVLREPPDMRAFVVTRRPTSTTTTTTASGGIARQG